MASAGGLTKTALTMAMLMTGSAHSLVLAIDGACALIATGVADDRDVHDQVASRLLRDKTGRPDLTVSRRPSGRPRLSPPWPELSVSLSYRDGMLLVGFDSRCHVGVDIEPASDLRDPERFAADHFTAAEADAVRRTPAPEAQIDFVLRLWTAKEAALKLTGRGIYDGLAEPDLAAHLSALTQDGSAIHLPAGLRLPALDLCVARVSRPDVPDGAYCALARARLSA